MMYLRFVTAQRDADSHQNSGVFQLAYDLYQSGDLRPDEANPLGAALVWFERNLPEPDRSKLDARAIFWFKASAVESARRIWDLAEIMKKYGLYVEVIKTTRPGYLVYEDDHQIASIPFRDTIQKRNRRNT